MEQVFTQKEQIFYNKYAGNFATPKKLNRSSKSIDSTYIDTIENGEVTSKLIQELGAKVPVFTYKTCITIHGNLPDIQRDRIGGYKNLIQNKNGSLEVRYSAIDYKLKKDIAVYLSKYGWQRSENSTNGIHFVKVIRTQSKVEALATLQEFNTYIDKFSVNGLKAKVWASGYNYFGMYYVGLNIMPLTISETAINVAAGILNLDIDTLVKDDAEREEKRLQRETEAAEAAQKRKEQQEQADELRKGVISDLLTDSKFRIAKSYDKSTVYLRVVVKPNVAPQYHFYYDNSFNNLKVSSNYKPIPEAEPKKSVINKTDLKKQIELGNVIECNF